MSINTIINYREGFVLTTNLQLVGKNEYFKVIWYKFTGQLDVKSVAGKIEKVVDEYLERKDLTNNEFQQLLSGLNRLHSKFTEKKNLDSLDLVIKKIENHQISLQPKTKVNQSTDRLETVATKTDNLKPVSPPPSSPNQKKLTSKRITRSKAEPQKIPDMPKSSSPSSKSPKKRSIKQMDPKKTDKSKTTTSTKTTETAEIAQKNPPSIADFAKLQEKINQLNPDKPYELKKIAKEIYDDVRAIIKENPKFSTEFQPLLFIMNELAIKGDQAFKLNMIQEYLCKKFQASGSPISHKKLLQKFIKSIQTSSEKKSGDHLVKLLPEIVTKWENIKENFFTIQLKNLSEDKIDACMDQYHLLVHVSQELASTYDDLIELSKSVYSDELHELMNQYPSYDIHKNKEIILEEILEKMINSGVDLDYEKLCNKGKEEIAYHLSYYLQRYDWFEKNISCLKTPYEQMANIDSNVNGGVCLQASLLRHQLLLKNKKRNKDTPIIDLKIGGDATARLRQAKVLANFRLTSEWRTMVEKFGYTIGPRSSSPYKVDRASSEEFVQAVNTLIKSDEPLIALFDMSSSNPSIVPHVFNIQLDPKNKRYRILDEDVGAIEFSTYKEFKEEFANYLEAFYSGYNIFQVIVPKE